MSITNNFRIDNADKFKAKFRTPPPLKRRPEAASNQVRLKGAKRSGSEAQGRGESMERIWDIKPRTSQNLIDQLLDNRRIDPQDRDRFLKPNFATDLPDPLLIKGVDQAVQRFWSAMTNHELIGLFGDYDADGTPAVALLYDLITFVQANQPGQSQSPVVYIPSRQEGYGLSEKGLKFFQQAGVKVMIAVDLGITAATEVSVARSAGIDVIIIDHHLVQEDKLPKEQAIIINPKQPGCPYPFKDLSACGLAWKFGVAVLAEGLKRKIITQGQLEREIKWALDLVAISTITDLVPLIGENRVLTHFGLTVLSKTRRLGLRALYGGAGIDPSQIDSYTVGFRIGPRLNAAGRLDQAPASFDLLTTKDPTQASQLAQLLNSLNYERQQLMEEYLLKAFEMIEAGRLGRHKAIIVGGEAWPTGVAGLIAGKIVEVYHRPTLVYSVTGDSVRGSARSVDRFHIVDGFDQLKTLLEKFGGHAKAAGFTLKKVRFNQFCQRFVKLVGEQLTDRDLLPRLSLDCQINPEEINLQLIDELARLEPFGLSNPRPLFYLPACVVRNSRPVGRQNQHLQLELDCQGYRCRGIGFAVKNHPQSIKVGDRLDWAVNLVKDVWRGRSAITLKVIDWRTSR